MANAEVISTTHSSDLKKWKKFSQMGAVLIILLSIPVTVYLVNRFILYLSQAAPNAHLFLHSAPSNVTNGHDVIFELDLEGGDLVASKVTLTFDTSKVRIQGSHSLNDKLETVVFKTDVSDANSTGKYTLVMADNPDAGEVFSGREEVARFTFVPAPGASGTTKVDFDLENLQFVNSDQLEYRVASFSPDYFTVDGSTVGIPDTDLWMEASDDPVDVGGNFTVDLHANPNSNLVVGVQSYITFDNTKLEAVDVTPGNFILNHAEIDEVIDNTNGTIAYTIISDPDIQGESTQPGVYASILFNAIGEGTASIDFENTTIVGATDVGEGDNAENALKSATGVDVTVTDVVITPTITVTPGPDDCEKGAPGHRPGDINEDCSVNILDYVIWYENFGLDPANDPRADINEDGSVDILDYVIWYENIDFFVGN